MTSKNKVNVQPFEIKDCALIALATGKKAQNLRELKELLATIGVDSIYYHFWGRQLRPRFDNPEYHNDFGIWSAYNLHDKALAERLAIIDPADFRTLDDLRNEIVEVIEERLDEMDNIIWTTHDEQFEFINSQIVIFKTNRLVSKPNEFVKILPTMSVGSIFYHFIDARRRLQNGVDDFQNWLKNFGTKYQTLSNRINEIDPYFTSLTKLREELTEVFIKYFKGGVNA